MELTISKENYLKAIAEAQAEGERVIPATLVRWLNVTSAAVAMATKRLQRDGYVQVMPDRHLQITPTGREIADRIRHRHHLLIERMLTELFGMEWYKVHDEAEQLEHAVSEEFEQKLSEETGYEVHLPARQPGHGRCPSGSAGTGLDHPGRAGARCENHGHERP